MFAVHNITCDPPDYLGSKVIDGVALRLKMSGDGQVLVAQSDAGEMLFEPSLKSPLCLTDIDFATITARDGVDHISHLAMERSADAERATITNHLCVGVQKWTSRTTLFNTRMRPWTQRGNTSRGSSKPGADKLVPNVGHALVCHSRGQMR